MADLIDAGTLVLMLALGTMTFGVVLLFAKNTDQLDSQLWALGFLGGGAGLMLLVLRGVIPDAVSIHVGNTVILAGVGCMILALAVYTKRSAMMYAVIAWFVVSVALFNIAAGPPISAPTHVRTLIIAGVVAISQVMALMTLSGPQAPPSRLLNVLRITHAVLALSFALRFAYIYATYSESAYADAYPFFGSDVPNVLFFIAAIFIAYVQGPAFVLMKKQVADQEALDARKQLAEEVASRWAERRLEASRLDDARADTIEHFARGIAHDGNNVIGVLQLGYGQIRDQIKRRQKVGADALRLMETALDQARVITSGLMAMSGREPSPLQDVCVEGVVEEVASMLESTLPSTIRLKAAVDPGLIAHTHRGFLISSLFNLASNARDAMPRGGTLRIDARHRQGMPDGQVKIGADLSGSIVDIAVTDEGPGIDPERCTRMFRPMFTTKEQGDGHGYGLYMVQGVVDRTGAALVVETAAGQGTTMHFLITEIKRG